MSDVTINVDGREMSRIDYIKQFANRKDKAKKEDKRLTEKLKHMGYRGGSLANETVDYIASCSFDYERADKVMQGSSQEGTKVREIQKEWE